MNFLHFLMTVCAVWRLTRLLNKEDGPFDVIYLLRKKAGTGFFGNLLDCFYCLSIWIAFPFGMWEGTIWHAKLLYWIAFSGAACLLEQATGATKNSSIVSPSYEED